MTREDLKIIHPIINVLGMLAVVPALCAMDAAGAAISRVFSIRSGPGGAPALRAQ
jgi:hypothetical protein